MDANEFLKKVKPRGQRSKLAPYWGDITKLRESDCTLEQVCEFLALNNVQISVAGLSKYIKKQEGKKSTDKTNLTKEVKNEISAVQNTAPKIENDQSANTQKEPKKISNPSDLKKARDQEVNLDDYE